MRERTTWNREAIEKMADDPRAMNQDHHSQQPAADKYLIDSGTPSEFAEDVHPSGNNWKAETDGSGNTKRNEIGQPEMRGDTFNHPESAPGSSPGRGSKSASDEAPSEESTIKKADVCVRVARSMLPKDASEEQVEDQALALMDLSDSSLVETANRLAGQGEDDKQSDDDDGDDDKQAAQQQQSDDDDDDDDQGKEAKGKIPPQFLENVKKKQDEAQGKQDDDDDKGQQQGKGQQKGQQQDDDKGQQKQAVEALTSAIIEAAKSDDKDAVTKLIAALPGVHYKHTTPGYAEGQPQQMQQPEQMQQQAPEQMQQQAPQAPAPEQMQQQAPEQMQDDGAMLDQMLAEPAPMEQDMGMMAGDSADIVLEGAQMDTGETVLDENDAVLQNLFASHKEVHAAQKAAELSGEVVPSAIAPVAAAPVAAPAAPQAVQASGDGMTRTAATRTVGTHPTQGVSALGGGPAAGGGDDTDKLSSLWNSAPDVSEVFNPTT